jgi:FtsZ-binding cell division protein ZapB|tara:strand:- start:305 stop:559 length:255 start_codon:yes stop_codon:yes gene_type:complete
MKDDRGDNDLEVVIDKLTKQKELLQFKCRQAGDTIKGYQMLVEEQKKDIWNLKKISQENEKNINLLQGYKKVIEDLSIKLRKNS